MYTRPYLAFLRNAHFEMCSRRRMPQGFRNALHFSLDMNGSKDMRC